MLLLATARLCIPWARPGYKRDAAVDHQRIIVIGLTFQNTRSFDFSLQFVLAWRFLMPLPSPETRMFAQLRKSANVNETPKTNR